MSKENEVFTDDLVKRLPQPNGLNALTQEPVQNKLNIAAADRIEELEANALANRVAIMRLEAKLAKAVTGLNSIASNTCCDRCQEAALVARTTLAELKRTRR